MLKGYIPLDKSWTMRMGFLDLMSGSSYIKEVLAGQEGWGDDLQALKRCVADWISDRPLDVGESGTLYRFLQFASWKLNLNKRFIRRGTLRDRSIHQDPAVVNYPLAELLMLDNGTSQWASAAVLMGNKEIVPRPPYKLALTYEAVDHWKAQRKRGEHWLLRYDETILRQTTTFLSLFDGREEIFVPEQAEDYCFARAFGYITKDEGAKRWPNLRGHESDRIREMDLALEAFEAGEEISSADHRVLQAVAMLGRVRRKEARIVHPSSVNKSWPQFWALLNSLGA